MILAKGWEEGIANGSAGDALGIGLFQLRALIGPSHGACANEANAHVSLLARSFARSARVWRWPHFIGPLWKRVCIEAVRTYSLLSFVFRHCKSEASIWMC
ncbi:hypothetical protein CMV14_14695 [Rhizorhabdus dicambivorans]|nr:hypothetical protein CMV14_14695 [Rhizorhabdus dicambivorans]